MACIVLNAIVMALTWYPSNEDIYEATTYINYVFTIYFLLEMLVKLVRRGTTAVQLHYNQRLPVVHATAQLVLT
jgi:hypothetical protein